MKSFDIDYNEDLPWDPFWEYVLGENEDAEPRREIKLPSREKKKKRENDDSSSILDYLIPDNDTRDDPSSKRSFFSGREKDDSSSRRSSVKSKNQTEDNSVSFSSLSQLLVMPSGETDKTSVNGKSSASATRRNNKVKMTGKKKETTEGASIFSFEDSMSLIMPSEDTDESMEVEEVFEEADDDYSYTDETEDGSSVSSEHRRGGRLRFWKRKNQQTKEPEDNTNLWFGADDSSNQPKENRRVFFWSRAKRKSQQSDGRAVGKPLRRSTSAGALLTKRERSYDDEDKSRSRRIIFWRRNRKRSDGISQRSLSDDASSSTGAVEFQASKRSISDKEETIEVSRARSQGSFEEVVVSFFDIGGHKRENERVRASKVAPSGGSLEDSMLSFFAEGSDESDNEDCSSEGMENHNNGTKSVYQIEPIKASGDAKQPTESRQRRRFWAKKDKTAPDESKTCLSNPYSVQSQSTNDNEKDDGSNDVSKSQGKCDLKSPRMNGIPMLLPRRNKRSPPAVPGVTSQQEQPKDETRENESVQSDSDVVSLSTAEHVQFANCGWTMSGDSGASNIEDKNQDTEDESAQKQIEDFNVIGNLLMPWSGDSEDSSSASCHDKSFSVEDASSRGHFSDTTAEQSSMISDTALKNEGPFEDTEVQPAPQVTLSPSDEESEEHHDVDEDKTEGSSSGMKDLTSQPSDKELASLEKEVQQATLSKPSPRVLLCGNVASKHRKAGSDDAEETTESDHKGENIGYATSTAKDTSHDEFALASGLQFHELSPQQLAEIFPKVCSIVDDKAEMIGNSNSFDHSFLPARIQTSLPRKGKPQSLIEYEYETRRHMFVSYSEFGPDPKACVKLGASGVPQQDECLPGTVVVQVEASTVSQTDCLIRHGLWWGNTEAPLPNVPGAEMAGKIYRIDKKTSDKFRLNVGDRVLSLTKWGANSRFLCVNAPHLVRVPDTVDPSQAVCLTETYLAAFQFLHKGTPGSRRYRKNSLKGKTVLILGPLDPKMARAVSQLASQAGLENIYAIAKQKHFNNLQSLGIVPLSQDSFDWYDSLKKHVDCIVSFEEEVSELHARLLKKEGHIVLVCSTELKIDDLKYQATSSKVMCKRNEQQQQCKTTVYDVYKEWDDNLEGCKKDLEHLVYLLDSGAITPYILDRIPLSKVPKAQELVETRRLSGFLVCEPWMVAKTRALRL